MGLLKQVTDQKHTAPVLVVSKSVSPEAKQKLAELYDQGLLDPALMDQHCMGLLAALPQASQVTAITSIAANIGAADNKQGYIMQLLKNMRASATSIAGSSSKPASQQHNKPGTAGGRVLSNTGKLINPNEVSIRLNPSSNFYDAELAMYWRVLTKQDQIEWQNRLTKGKQMKLDSLSKPRQELAGQLHPGHLQYNAATASIWKHTDAAVKEEMLRSADQSGDFIDVDSNSQQHSAATGPQFLEVEFPPLAGSESGQPDQTDANVSGTSSEMPVPAAVSSATQRHSSTTSGTTPLSHARLLSGDQTSESRSLYSMGMTFQPSVSLEDSQPDLMAAPCSDSMASRSAAVSVASYCMP